MNKKIHELRQDGWGCAQTMVFMALDELGETNDTMITGLGALNGGVKSKDICGILTGGTIAMELLLEDKGCSPMVRSKKTAELVEWFEHELGSIRCKDLMPSSGCKVYATELGTMTWTKIQELVG